MQYDSEGAMPDPSEINSEINTVAPGERTGATAEVQSSATEASPTGFEPEPTAPPPRKQGVRDWLGRSGRLLLIPLILLLVLAGGIAGGMIGARLTPAPGATTSGQTGSSSASVTDLQRAVENVSQGARPSVVELTSSGASQSVIGSGIVLTKDGYIATNDHMVRGYTDFIVVLYDGSSYSAQLVGQDAQEDLAVLKIAASNLKPITFAASNTVKVGQFVVAIGSPVGLEYTATFGIVSAVDRAASEPPDGSGQELSGLIQTNATLNPGNSGGALLDLQGRLIGMPTLGITATSDNPDVEGIGFAIPADRVRSVTARLIQAGR